MTGAPHADNPIPAEQLQKLLHTALEAQRHGDRATARSLLRALSVHTPGDLRVWLALAVVAETRDEQRRALEQVLVIDPQNRLAQRGLERFRTADPSETPTIAMTTPAATPSAATEPVAAPVVAEVIPAAAVPVDATAIEPEQEPRSRSFTPLIIITGVAIVLLVALYLWWPRSETTVTTQPTPALSMDVTAPAEVLPSPVIATLQPTAPSTAIPTVVAAATDSLATTSPTNTVVVSSTATLTDASPLPTLEPQETLPIGEVLTEGDWHTSLLKPDDAVVLEGSIGDLQPKGRFVLAMMTVSNSGTDAVRIPVDLFVLQDNQGRRYQPDGAASSAFLNAFGRAQRGDLSFEEAIPPDLGNVTVPIIFDVPLSASGLQILVGNNSVGWPVTGS